MGKQQNICLVGQVCVDVSLGSTVRTPKLRLGGIFHAARALWAMDIPYKLAYIAPSYLSNQISDYALHHAALSVNKLGEVEGSPNVILIQEPTEAGPQGYEFLLRDEHKTHLDHDQLRDVCEDKSSTDFLVFPGGFALEQVLAVIGDTRARVHIDIGYGVTALHELSSLGRKFDLVAISTSSDLFVRKYGGSIASLSDETLREYGNGLLFKENRGGSRYYQSGLTAGVIHVDAQVRPIVHSVGVGDCFDVAFVAQRINTSDSSALAYASWVAAAYASTTFPDDFKRETKRILSILPEEISQVQGISLPWEERQECQIYIAAPDFDFVDRTPINRMVDSLRYHNFTPRLPVRENGQMELNASRERRQQLFDADLKILSECKILLAVLIENDPGTLIEVGIAAERGVPVIVYDPFNRAENLMLTQLPTLVSSSLDEVISEVFRQAAKELKR